MWVHCPAFAQEGAGLSTQQQRGGRGEAVLTVSGFEGFPLGRSSLPSKSVGSFP